VSSSDESSAIEESDVTDRQMRGAAMSRVVLELSISLDGFVAGTDVGPGAPLGIGGEGLHEWMFAGKSSTESETFETAHFSEIGALILGRRTADLGIGPWGEEPTFHAPCFVVTHRPAETIVKQGGTSYIFVTDGIEAALERARQAAGSQDVQVIGGAGVAQEFLNRGLLDEIRLHLVPILLGAGTRLFDGVRTDVRLLPRETQNAPAVTHLIYDVGHPTTAR
jgi:dihydrofolate reductase